MSLYVAIVFLVVFILLAVAVALAFIAANKITQITAYSGDSRLVTAYHKIFYGAIFGIGIIILTGFIIALAFYKQGKERGLHYTMMQEGSSVPYSDGTNKVIQQHAITSDHSYIIALLGAGFLFALIITAGILVSIGYVNLKDAGSSANDAKKWALWSLIFFGIAEIVVVLAMICTIFFHQRAVEKARASITPAVEGQGTGTKVTPVSTTPTPAIVI